MIQSRYSITLIIFIITIVLSSSRVASKTLTSEDVIKFNVAKFSTIKNALVDTDRMIDEIYGHLKHLLVERVSDTPSHAKVARYIASQFESNSNWKVEYDIFNDTTPHGTKKFTNIIVTSTHPLNDDNAQTIVLAAHYDSKYFKDFKFIGAVDSAVPCAMIIELAQLMQESNLLIDSNSMSKRRKKKN
ncbi:peptidase M28E domain containing-protein [Cavenderia fasciculata]|uniref:Peptidase M28E domain containing-protein n=1 Tax=Cavenderia fasciculata TaxID=261658 RepID=F4Q7L6_CACFS|nr:peptidase M28E domain containing-protein [Cavenderia fasciculata]EGG16398.1 peptidase M28E domain containing-protein [Cavenderia fasciculata]|eukprot:XP_004354782.1 peptidase M28E domain containing-protein [Cavenderia fasciculata]